MELVGKLDHQNIVRFLAAGESNGSLFLVMEDLRGYDLSRLVELVGPLPIAAACSIAHQAAKGLAQAHERGLIHRDVKPSNLFLTEDGLVKVLDLGLARPVHVEDETLTESGMFLGTIDYMAPEQAFDTHTADLRSDIYSLGCTLYKLLLGVAPFSGPKYRHLLKKALAHSSIPMVPIREHRSEVPEKLASIIERMCAKSPEDRFQSWKDVAGELLPYFCNADLPGLISKAQSLDATARQAASTQTRDPAHPAPPILQRTPTPRWLPTAAVTAVLLAGLMLWRSGPVSREPVTPDRSAQEAAGEGASPSEGSETPAITPLDAAPAPSALITTDLAPFEVARIAQKAQRSWIWALHLSADGQLLRTANNDGDLRAWEIETGIQKFTARQSDTADHPTHAFAISREETFCVAVGFPAYVTLWDLVSGTKNRQFDGDTDRVVAVSISPDQTRAVTGSWDGAVRVWDLATGDSVHTLEPDIGKVLAVSFSPDGLLIAAAGRSSIALLDAATGEKVRSLRGPRAYFNAVAFTSDSAFLASGDRDNAARLWRVADGELVRTFEGHTNFVNAVAISADDKLLLTGSSDRTARLWSLGTGELLREYVGHTKPVNAVAFRPQSQQVVSGGEDDEVRFWAIPEEPIERQHNE